MVPPVQNILKCFTSICIYKTWGQLDSGFGIDHQFPNWINPMSDQLWNRSRYLKMEKMHKGKTLFGVKS